LTPLSNSSILTMPYTPPSQQSPASTRSNSPSVSRTASFSDDAPVRNAGAGRPQPPRSMSSASYLHKHRRTPSLNQTDSPLAVSTEPHSHVDAPDFGSSLRQHPAPINNLRIPTGAVISPPDSPENSDDGDDGVQRGRGKDLKTWDQLQQAVRSIPLRREGSPAKQAVTIPLQTSSAPVSQSTSPSALSPEQRKISHSRSATETKIMIRTPFAEVVLQTSDDSEEDESLLNKPALVRKKSGELVKPALRPSSRRRYSSMPGTPTYSKQVHFNDNDNQTRHFLQVDKPIAVSAGSSPVETFDSEAEFPFDGDDAKAGELEIKFSNFPSDTPERRAQPVRVERLYLSTDKQLLIGVCAVQNIAFQKLVAARFTLDYWKTTSEVAAEYSSDLRHPSSDGCDRFTFQIRLSDQANIIQKTMFLCIRYTVGPQEFWDNNDNTNYQIDFVKAEPKPTRPTRPRPALGQRPVPAIPRSRHTIPSPRSASFTRDSADDDFLSGFDSTSYDLGSLSKLLGESTASIKLKPRSKRPPLFTADSSPAANGLGSRYDFGTSLSAALSSAHGALGRQSGLMQRMTPPKSQSGGSYFAPATEQPVEKPQTPTTERPDSLTTDRPAIGSDQYKDLVQKFCYFTPVSGKGVTSPRTSGPPAVASVASTPAESGLSADQQVDGASETEPLPVSPARVIASSSPSAQHDGSNERGTSSWTSFVQRASSPGSASAVQNLGSRTSGSVSFGFPYHKQMREGYFSEAPTPTAIRG